MLVVNKTSKGMQSLSAKEVPLENLSSVKSKLALRILKLLAEKPSYPKEISRKLKVHEQKVYYHIRNLERARLIEVSRQEIRMGATANIYRVTKPAYVVRLKEFDTASSLSSQSHDFLDPFIEDGTLNCSIIVGSPDPHGPEKARSRDGYYGMDLALFLGSHLNSVSSLNIVLDTETNSDHLSSNLILIGGPVVNTITGKVNKKLPIRFGSDNSIYSTLSQKTYLSDETGIIVKMTNPFNSRRKILVVAGKRNQGTRSVIIGFLKHFEKLSAGNTHNSKIFAHVVEGIDYDSDGVVDDIEILE